jgi:hypothetical protein
MIHLGDIPVMKTLSIELDDVSKGALRTVLDTALRAGGMQVLPAVSHVLALVARAEAAAASNVVPLKQEDAANG